MEYKQNDLLAMSDEEILMMKGCPAEVITIRNEKIEGIITQFQLAANKPHMVCAICINHRVLTLDAIKSLSIHA